MCFKEGWSGNLIWPEIILLKQPFFPKINTNRAPAVEMLN